MRKRKQWNFSKNFAKIMNDKERQLSKYDEWIQELEVKEAKKPKSRKARNQNTYYEIRYPDGNVYTYTNIVEIARDITNNIVVNVPSEFTITMRTIGKKKQTWTFNK